MRGALLSARPRLLLSSSRPQTSAAVALPALTTAKRSPIDRSPTAPTRRNKSSHEAIAPRPPPSIFKPKPSLPHSVHTPGDQPITAGNASPDTSAPRADSSSIDSPPPKLVRYERREDGSITAWHHYPPPAHILLQQQQQTRGSESQAAPTSIIANKTSAAGLFGIYPSTTRAAAAVNAARALDASAAGAPVTISDEMTATTRSRKSSKSLKEDAQKHEHAAESKANANGSAAKGHSHGGIFHSHDHSHGPEGSVEEADQLLAALRGKGDRGANITLVGLASNVALCAAKGAGGVYLHSAALLADAAHSLSDLFADLVTLFCWKMSQRPASATHPLGYGKFETMGSLGVSLVLVAGAVGIGFHSYGLLLEALQPTLQHAPTALQVLGRFTESIAGVVGHSHGAAEKAVAGAAGEEAAALDPNAMWFALVSIVVKEWLYWATLKIAREENSSVLEANALHHRSDSLSSAVTFLAIGASWMGFPVLDPLGGLLVAGLIGKQGADLLVGALAELSDVGVEPSVLKDFETVLEDVQKQFPDLLVAWKDLRAVKSGVSTFVDVTLEMPPNTKLSDARKVEAKVREAITASLRGVSVTRSLLILTKDGPFRIADTRPDFRSKRSASRSIPRSTECCPFCTSRQAIRFYSSCVTSCDAQSS